MNKLKMVESIVQELMEDEEFHISLQNIFLQESDMDDGIKQKSSPIYLLAAKLPVKGKTQDKVYHYFLLIKDCVLDTEGSENILYAAQSKSAALSLQKKLVILNAVDIDVLEVSANRFKEIKKKLDITLSMLINKVEMITKYILEDAGESEWKLKEISRDAIALYFLKRPTVFGSPLMANGKPAASDGKVEYDVSEVNRMCKQVIKDYCADTKMRC